MWNLLYLYYKHLCFLPLPSDILPLVHWVESSALWGSCFAVRRWLWPSSFFSLKRPTAASVNWESWEWSSSEMWVNRASFLSSSAIPYYMLIMSSNLFLSAKPWCERVSEEVCEWSETLWGDGQEAQWVDPYMHKHIHQDQWQSWLFRNDSTLQPVLWLATNDGQSHVKCRNLESNYSNPSLAEPKLNTKIMKKKM